MMLSMAVPSLNGKELIEYTSPTIVIAAIAIVLMFSSVTVPEGLKRCTGYCTPFVLSIYLLHEHPLVRENLIYDRFTWTLSLPGIVQVLLLLGVSIAIWLVCFGMDHIRLYVFRLVKLDNVIQKIESKCDSEKK